MRGFFSGSLHSPVCHAVPVLVGGNSGADAHSNRQREDKEKSSNGHAGLGPAPVGVRLGIIGARARGLAGRVDSDGGDRGPRSQAKTPARSHAHKVTVNAVRTAVQDPTRKPNKKSRRHKYIRLGSRGPNVRRGHESGILCRLRLPVAVFKLLRACSVQCRRGPVAGSDLAHTTSPGRDSCCEPPGGHLTSVLMAWGCAV